MIHNKIHPQPAVITHSVLIDAYCKENKLEKALELINSMRQYGVAPSVVIYNSIMDKVFKAGNIE